MLLLLLGRKGTYGVPVGVITLVKCVLDMAKTKGSGSLCSAKGCNRRRKAKCDQLEDRSDSDGTSDEESSQKRQYPRTFHK